MVMAPERKYSDRDMLKEIKRVKNKLGKSPTWNEFDENSDMWAQIIANRFGSWNKAKEEANLESYAYLKGGNKTKPKNSKESLYRYKKEEGSCKYCDEDFKECLVFHHKDDSDKKFNVSKYDKDAKNIEELAEEIRKCVIVCANCHRKLHSENHDLHT